MSTLTMQRGLALPGSALVTAGAVTALILVAATSGSFLIGSSVPVPSVNEPAAVTSSPMIAAGLPADTVADASPITSTAPIDYGAAVVESPESWPARSATGATAPDTAVTAPASAPVTALDHQAPATDEVLLIPAAIAWRDDDGVVHQGLIGVDDIPAEVLALPEGVTLEE
ncbi:MAG: hypothetical protein GY713_04000 [Actinomycetia bacterium]|nr:hypothetical protein [Actinomycetes bacterium]